VLKNEELMRLVLPTLRGDFQLTETYQTSSPLAVPCPVIAFGGSGDRDVSRSDLEEWRQTSNGDFRLHMLEGGHFFVNSERPRLIGLVLSELARWTE
jgi:medium-chain acyl-[acyl-carrier-protein] hydrolase